MKENTLHAPAKKDRYEISMSQTTAESAGQIADDCQKLAELTAKLGLDKVRFLLELTRAEAIKHSSSEEVK